MSTSFGWSTYNLSSAVSYCNLQGPHSPARTSLEVNGANAIARRCCTIKLIINGEGTASRNFCYMYIAKRDKLCTAKVHIRLSNANSAHSALLVLLLSVAQAALHQREYKISWYNVLRCLYHRARIQNISLPQIDCNLEDRRTHLSSISWVVYFFDRVPTHKIKLSKNMTPNPIKSLKLKLKLKLK